MLEGTHRKDEGETWCGGADKIKADPPARSAIRGEGEGRWKAGWHRRLQGNSPSTEELPQSPQGKRREAWPEQRALRWPTELVQG